MGRLPLILSAHTSAWIADAAQAGRGAATSLPASCRFCGQPTCGWQEVFHLNGNHDDNGVENLVVSCPLCHLAQHLGRMEIEREAELIWLPEMAQTALNLLAREIHLRCYRDGASSCFAAEPHSDISIPTARDAHAAYRALHERAVGARSRLNTTSPRRLGMALLELAPDDYDRRVDLLGGIRLLPLGQIFRDGRDIYPDMLRAWATDAEANRSTQI